MHQVKAKSLLRIQLANRSLRQMKDRASVYGRTPGEYADMIFHYLVQDKTPIRLSRSEKQSEEEVYFMLEIPDSTRRKLVDWSGREQRNLASFGGCLISGFLGKFTEDPRDFGMVYHISGLLEEKPILSQRDLQEAVGQYISRPGAALPTGYLIKWFFSRLKPMVGSIEKNGEEMELTAPLVEEVLRLSGRVK